MKFTIREKNVCPSVYSSVCLSNAWIVTKWKKEILGTKQSWVSNDLGCQAVLGATVPGLGCQVLGSSGLRYHAVLGAKPWLSTGFCIMRPHNFFFLGGGGGRAPQSLNPALFPTCNDTACHSVYPVDGWLAFDWMAILIQRIFAYFICFIFHQKFAYWIMSVYTSGANVLLVEVQFWCGLQQL